VMEFFRNPNGIVRTVNLAILAFFITTFYAPSALAMKLGIEEQQKQAKLEASLPHNQNDAALYAHTLKQMKGHFQEAERLYNDQDKSLIGQLTDIKNAIQTGDSLFKNDDRWKQELNQGLTLATQAIGLNDNVDQDFQQVKQWIAHKELPNTFIERHQQAYSDYQTRYGDFINKLTPLQQASNDDTRIDALKQLNQYLANQQFGRKHQDYNHETMGNSAPVSAKDKSLLLTRSDYFNQGIDSNPAIQLAALGEFDFSQLPNADDPAFLAESDEVTLSQAIQDQAAALEQDPVKIYHWVRNNIETIPGYGSYQNADLTLGAQRGNPFDVASLLIALLRASQIPARYAFGVAEIDADRYTNWLGNFDNADIASNYASNNGIATQMVTSGGQITKIRTQHIWVQAAIDYFPSRGAKNRSADSWVDMDASFKQYDYQEGLDAIDITGIDAEALANQFVNSGTVNEADGFVQNLDPTELLNAQQQAQTQLLTDPTVGDVIGGRRTIIKEYPTLPSGLPYNKFNQGPTFGKIPTNLQNKVAVGFDSNRQTFPFAKVNNEKVTLQFTPATQADEDALAALLPEGEITDVSQLPSSIPSYLVSVIPELSLNGEVFLQGNAMRLGNEINLTYQLSGPLTTYAPYNYSVIAGSYLNVPLVAQTVNPGILESLESTLEQTRLKSLDQNLNNVSREEFMGDLFYAGSLGYFSEYLGLTQVFSIQERGNHKLEFGYGSYGYEPEQNTFFGIPRGIESGGVAFNIRLANTVEGADGDSRERINLRYQAGLISSFLENVVIEQMFSESDNLVRGISSVEALKIASEQGQRLVKITGDNVSESLNSISLDSSVEDEIRSYVRDDQIAIAHSNPVSKGCWIYIA